MRSTRLGVALLATVLVVGAAEARVLGRHRGVPCPSFGPPVVAYPYYAYPAYPAYPTPFVHGPSYFRPEAPLGWNAQRNWRDTWQDDGVKVHGYRLR